jgi:hypothetical protein
VAAEIMAGRPPTIAIVTAIVNEENNPTRGSTPAMIENEIASGISAITETAQSYGSRIHHDKRKNQFAIVTGTSRIAQLAAWALATQTRNLQPL